MRIKLKEGYIINFTLVDSFWDYTYPGGTEVIKISYLKSPAAPYERKIYEYQCSKKSYERICELLDVKEV